MSLLNEMEDLVAFYKLTLNQSTTGASPSLDKLLASQKSTKRYFISLNSNCLSSFPVNFCIDVFFLEPASFVLFRLDDAIFLNSSLKN